MTDEVTTTPVKRRLTASRVSSGTHLDFDRAVLDHLWPATDMVLDEVACRTIAQHAKAGDATGHIAEEALDVLRARHYFGFAVPEELGGLGGDVVQSCALQRRLGMLDPALAIALNMHLFSVGVVLEHWVRERDASWALLEAIATQDRIVASGFAEHGLGGALLRSNFSVEAEPNAYVVTGRKSPCSLAARSDLICIQVETDEDRDDTLLICMLPTDAPGISVEATWDSMGMRASESDTVRFDRCRIPEELVFHRCRPGFDADEVFAAGTAWFCATTTATYLGVIGAAIEEAATLLRSTPLGYLDASRADLPSYQAVVGRALVSLIPLETGCVQLARLLDERRLDPRALLPVALGLKQAANVAAVQVLGELVEAVGGQAYGRSSRLGRLWRDAQAARFHPPTGAATHQILGRWFMGQPFTFEVSEAPVTGRSDR